MKEVYIEQINAALRDGVPPPKMKKLDKVVRDAPVIHVLSHVILIRSLLDKVEPTLCTKGNHEDIL